MFDAHPIDLETIKSRKLREALKTVNRFASTVNRIPKVNEGGCGVVALHIAKILKQFGLNPKLKTFSHGGNAKVNVSKAFKNVSNTANYWDWEIEGITLSHIVVYVRGYVVDSTGVYKNSQVNRWAFFYKPQRGTIPPEAIEDLCMFEDNWNPSFDRRWIRAIRKLANMIAGVV